MVRSTELRLRCPDIHTQSDETLVREKLSAAPGIGEVDIDFRTGCLRIVTANQDGGIDVKDRLSRAGFPPEN